MVVDMINLPPEFTRTPLDLLQNLHSPLSYILMNFSVFFKKAKYVISQQLADYKSLLDQIQSTVEGVPDLYSVSFIGPDNLNMTLNNQEDLEALFHLGKDYKIANLEVKDLSEDIFNMKIDMEEEEEQTNVVEKEEVYVQKKEERGERGVGCNGCGVNPIEGVRYSCPECEEYNLCVKCQEVVEHGHNLLKIKHPHLLSSNKKNINHHPLPHQVLFFPNSKFGIVPNQHPGSLYFPRVELDKLTLENASLIQEMFGVQLQKAIQFVSANPNLSKEQLVALAIEKRGY